MNRFFTISLCFLALSLSAQETITYPYNPDGDADGLVAVTDLQDILAVYGNPFSPAEIMVGDSTLNQWIYEVSQSQEALELLLNNVQILLNDSLSLELVNDTLWLRPTDSFVIINSTINSQGDVNTQPSYGGIEDLLPSSEEFGCSRRAVLGQGLGFEYENFYANLDNAVIGANNDGVILFDSFGRLWQIEGDDNRTLLSNAPFGEPIGIDSQGLALGNGGSTTWDYGNTLVDDSLVIIVSYLGSDQAKGVHVIRKNGEESHFSFPSDFGPSSYTSGAWQNEYFFIEFNYPWIIINESYTELSDLCFFNIEDGNVKVVSNINFNGTLSNDKFYFIDDRTNIQGSENPDYGLLKCFDLQSESISFIADLASAPNSEWYGTSGNGSTYALGFTFEIVERNDSIAIFKHANSSFKSQILVYNFNGLVLDEYYIHYSSNWVDNNTTYLYVIPEQKTGKFYWKTGAAGPYVYNDQVVYLHNTSPMTFDPFSASFYPICTPEFSTSIQNVNQPTRSFFETNYELRTGTGFFYRYPMPRGYLEVLGIDAVFFY